MNRKKVTIREVAKEAGVSVATVSRYLNKNGYISEGAENKIKEVMKQLDYQPNEIARGLARKKTNTIALIIPDIKNPFFPELVVAIDEIARLKGYSIVLINTEERELENNHFWRNLQSRYIDGFIIASFHFNHQVLQTIESLHVPFVRIDRAANNDAYHSIEINNYKGATLATEHLIEIGCKHIAHISGPKSYLPSIDRVRGFTDAINKIFPEKAPIIYEGDFTFESGKVITNEIMLKNPHIDGIFLANDLMAIGAIKALKTMNMNVPKDIAIVGFDGIELTNMVEPEISTVEQPIYEIGVAATNKLIHLIEKKADETLQIELDVRLVKRESTLGFVPH